jgi:hypothetical protein
MNAHTFNQRTVTQILDMIRTLEATAHRPSQPRIAS